MTSATLSPLEQRIYFATRNARDGVVFLEVLDSLRLTDKRTLLFAVSKMAKKGWLMRLRKGVYLMSEPGAAAITDPFVISTYVFPGYNAFSSALYVHKLTDMVPFEILVATRNESRIKRVGGYTFRAVALKKRYGGSEDRQGIKVSTRAKTFYDCIIHPELAGGFPGIVKAFHESGLTQKEWNELLYYADKYETAAFFQRLGYLLDILPAKTKEIRRIIGICSAKVGSRIYLYKRRHGAFVSKWKIVDDIGKDELLSWWY